MNPMTFGRQCLGHDICHHVARRDILNGNETILVGLSNEVILDINVFRSFVKAQIFSKLNRSLIINKEELQMCRLIRLGVFKK